MNPEKLQPKSDSTPDYVRDLNNLVKTIVWEDPNRGDEFAQIQDGLTLGFGEAHADKNPFVSARFSTDSPLAKQLAWMGTYRVFHKFLFSLDKDGSLNRNISFLNTQEKRTYDNIDANMGIDAGKAFAKFILEKPWDSPETIMQFCELDDHDLNAVVEIHHQIGLAQAEENLQQRARKSRP